MSLTSPAGAKDYKINGLVKDFSCDLRSTGDRKQLFVNLNDIQNHLPAEVLNDSLARIVVLAGSKNCVPVFYDDPHEFRIVNGEGYVEIGKLANAFGSSHWTVKKNSVNFTDGMLDKWLRPGADSGRVAPGFELKTVDNQTFSLSNLRHANGVVIAFVRSALWDPLSQEILRSLAANQQNLEKSGYRVAVVHGYEPDDGKAWSDSLDLSLPLLADSYGAVMRGYRVFDKGSNPLPSVFIIGTDGIISWKRVYRGEDTFDITEILDRVRIRE